MQAQLANKAQYARTLVEKLKDAIESAKTPYANTNYKVGFNLQISFGTLTDSETLSTLDKIEGALARFSKDQVIGIQIEVMPVSLVDEFVSSKCEEAFNTAVKLMESTPKLVALDAPAQAAAPVIGGK